MPIELKIPALGESITEVQIGEWLKKEGDNVAKDENVVTIESDKATVELPAPASGKLTKILKPNGATARVDDIIAQFEQGTTEIAAETKPPARTKPAKPEERGHEARPQSKDGSKATPPLRPQETETTAPGERRPEEQVTPLKQPRGVTEAKESPPDERTVVATRSEEIVPMSLFRQTVARHLVEAQRNAALLTTFNEIDLSSVIASRKEFQEAFQQKYGAKLGFMSFFVKAVVEALKQIPQLNAEVRGTDIVYRNYFDIGVAIGSGKGLVVPVLRHAERLSFAEIEKGIADFARRAQENKLKPEELQGGTFTISNGGVYGSLFSTPIVNPPQSGVLGMHAIQDRPVAIEGNVVIRPMMYVALTYDHRLVDGREAVTFLRRVKELIEKPARMLMEV
jgi:2-oxoglutarate dehydrogenase E2 component (dihydrolipoamide succinyltransferase)